MERLTIEQIEDIVDDLNTFDFLPVGLDGRKTYEQICKGAEQMRDELLAYKQLEEKSGCPTKQEESKEKKLLNLFKEKMVDSWFIMDELKNNPDKEIQDLLATYNSGWAMDKNPQLKLTLEEMTFIVECLKEEE